MMTRRQIMATAAALAASAPAAGFAGRRSGWSNGPRLPYPVQEIYPAALDGKIYLLGGLSPDIPESQGNISKRFLILDAESGQWSDGPDFPEPRHHPCLVANEGLIYAVGGYSFDQGGRWSNRATLHIFDPSNPGQGWTDGPDMPQPQAETIALSCHGRIHVIGGRRPAGGRNAQWNDHTDVTAHQIFDPASGDWLTGPPAPTARNSAAGAVIGDDLYIVGGRTVSGGNVDVLEAINLTPDQDRQPQWRRLSPMPQAQGGLAAAALGGKLYAFGGEYFSPEGGGVFSEAWVYSPKTDSWDAIEPMPTPRHGLGAVTMGNAIYTIAGAAEFGSAETSDAVEIFRP